MLRGQTAQKEVLISRFELSLAWATCDHSGEKRVERRFLEMHFPAAADSQLCSGTADLCMLLQLQE